MDNVCLVKLYNKGTQPAVEPKEEGMLLCALYSFVDVAHSTLHRIVLFWIASDRVQEQSRVVLKSREPSRGKRKSVLLFNRMC